MPSTDDLLLTMTVSRLIDELPENIDEDLFNTLRGLCSFKSLEDLVSFLFSENLCKMMSSSPWVVFEVGLYLDHTKTIEVVHYSDYLVIADFAASGVFSDNAETFDTQLVLQNKLAAWIAQFNP